MTIITHALAHFLTAQAKPVRCLLSGMAVFAVLTAQAETTKQISYPVSVPVEHAAVSSAAAPVYTAPEPVIRPIDQASSTPPKPAKKSAKSTVKTVKDDDMSSVKVPTKAPAKTTAKTPAKVEKPKAAVAKKAAPEKPDVKNPNTKAVAKVEPPKTPPAKSAPAKTANKPEAYVNSTPEKKTVEIQEPAQAQSVAQLKPLAAAAGPVAPPTTLLLENDTSESATDVSVAPDDKKVPEPEPPPPSYPAINNTPLPMSAQKEAFVSEFQSYVETKVVPRLPGAALAIIADGKVKVLQAYGVKKVNGRDPINTDTAFRLASVSKTIAGTTAGVMVHDGLITWDTLVTSVLPDVEFSNPKYGNQLTLQNILSQSTGLPTHTGDNYIEEGMAFSEVINKLKYVNFVCPPGKCYAYQNVSLSLLSNIVQKKTGKSYEQYVREKIFAPLGMHSASFGMDGLKANNNYALPHILTARGWYTETITENYYRINPAAGANASINDMSRWVLAQMGHNPDVLAPATLSAIHAKVTKNTPAQSHYGAADGVTDTHYGMGWRVFDYRGDKNFLHHGGYVLGFRSEMVFNPDLQIGMVILSNSNKIAGDIIFKFLDAYEDEKRGARKLSLPGVAPAKKKPRTDTKK